MFRNYSRENIRVSKRFTIEYYEIASEIRFVPAGIRGLQL